MQRLLELHLTIEAVRLTCPQCGYEGPLLQSAVDPHDQASLTECPRCGTVAPVTGSREVESMELKWE